MRVRELTMNRFRFPAILFVAVTLLAPSALFAAPEDVAAAKTEMRAGLDASKAGDWPAAVQHLEKALQLGPGAQWNAGQQATCLFSLGVAYGGIAAPEKQLASLQQALALFRQLAGTEWEQAECLRNLAMAYSALGNATREAEAWQQALDLYCKVPDTEGERALALVNLGLRAAAAGQWQREIELVQQALELYRKRPGEELGQAGCLQNLGSAYGRLGDSLRQVQFTQQALELYRALPGTKRRQADCLQNLGAAHTAAGKPDDYKVAVISLNAALTLYRQLPDTQREQARCLADQGVAEAELGDADREDASYREALALYRKVPGAECEQADCLVNLAVARLKAHDPDAALPDFIEGERLYREAMKLAGGAARQVPEGLCKAEAGLGRVYRRRGQPEDLYRAYRCDARAIKIIEYLRSHAAVSPALKTAHFAQLVWVYSEMVDLLLQMKREHVPLTPEKLAEAEPQFWADLGLPLPALWGDWASYEEAILHFSEGSRARALGDMMANAPIADAPTEVREAWGRANDLLAQEQELAARTQEAWRNRKPTLAASLAGQYTEVFQSRLQASLEFERLAFGGMAAPEPVSLAQARSLLAADEALAEYTLLRDRLAILLVTRASTDLWEVPLSSAPEGTSAGASAAGSDADIEARLGTLAREAGKRSGLPEGIAGIVPPARLLSHFAPWELTWLYRKPMNLLGSQDERGVLEARGQQAQQIRIAAALYDLLLRPIEARLRERGIRALTVVPDGALHYLPFGALVARLPGNVDEAAAGQVFAHPGVQYAAERWRLAQLPSVSLYCAMRQAAARRPAPSQRLCAFADPVFTATDLRARGPGTGAMRVAQRPALSQPGATRGASLRRLPNTRLEALAALGAFGHGQALVCKTPETMSWAQNVGVFSLAATKQRLQARDLSQYGYLLLATHALVRPDLPAYSYIALTNPLALGESGTTRAAVDDGCLMLPEVLGLHLNARLVTLSACRTAEGGLTQGEGVMGLTAAFFACGAQAVTASLWEVSDRATADLIGRYHELIASGASLAGSLQSAQLEMLARGRRAYGRDATSPEAAYAHPYYWAPFVLLGR